MRHIPKTEISCASATNIGASDHLIQANKDERTIFDQLMSSAKSRTIEQLRHKQQSSGKGGRSDSVSFEAISGDLAPLRLDFSEIEIIEERDEQNIHFQDQEPLMSPSKLQDFEGLKDLESSNLFSSHRHAANHAINKAIGSLTEKTKY